MLPESDAQLLTAYVDGEVSAHSARRLCGCCAAPRRPRPAAPSPGRRPRLASVIASATCLRFLRPCAAGPRPARLAARAARPSVGGRRPLVESPVGSGRHPGCRSAPPPSSTSPASSPKTLPRLRWPRKTEKRRNGRLRASRIAARRHRCPRPWLRATRTRHGGPTPGTRNRRRRWPTARTTTACPLRRTGCRSSSRPTTSARIGSAAWR